MPMSAEGAGQPRRGLGARSARHHARAIRRVSAGRDREMGRRHQEAPTFTSTDREPQRVDAPAQNHSSARVVSSNNSSTENRRGINFCPNARSMMVSSERRFGSSPNRRSPRSSRLRRVSAPIAARCRSAPSPCRPAPVRSDGGKCGRPGSLSPEQCAIRCQCAPRPRAPKHLRLRVTSDRRRPRDSE